MSQYKSVPDPGDNSRRDFLTATGTGLAALSVLAAGCSESAAPLPGVTPANRAAAPQAPFDSIRDYVAALEANGLLLRIPRIDQDQYLSTALMFRVVDKFGMFGAPALIF